MLTILLNFLQELQWENQLKTASASQATAHSDAVLKGFPCPRHRWIIKIQLQWLFQLFITNSSCLELLATARLFAHGILGSCWNTFGSFPMFWSVIDFGGFFQTCQWNIKAEAHDLWTTWGVLHFTCQLLIINYEMPLTSIAEEGSWLGVLILCDSLSLVWDSWHERILARIHKGLFGVKNVVLEMNHSAGSSSGDYTHTHTPMVQLHTWLKCL